MTPAARQQLWSASACVWPNLPVRHEVQLFCPSQGADAAPLAATHVGSMGFSVPISAENANGWGPPADAAPAEFADVPYSPFSKSDKLGRAADWTQTGFGKFGGSAWPGERMRAGGF